jgi:hypothetical protein
LCYWENEKEKCESVQNLLVPANNRLEVDNIVHEETLLESTSEARNLEYIPSVNSLLSVPLSSVISNLECLGLGLGTKEIEKQHTVKNCYN